MPLTEFTKNFIIENNLCNKTVLMGLSGGIDSCVLLDILFNLKDELNLNLIAIHLNHNWRGAASKSDENFAKAFALKRKIQFYSKTAPDNIKKNETAAREYRYVFFEECKNKFKADAVFSAHNKNDNVETLLYRLIKGTGPYGLLSIAPVRDFYFRPLLSFSRDEIENYAKLHNIDFVIDKSNFDIKHKRNLIRNKIIPFAKDINPNVINSITNFIELNKMSQNIIDEVIQKYQKEIFENEKIIQNKFLNLKIELQYEIINRYLKGILKTRDYKTIKKIVNFINENKCSKISVNSEFFLKIYNNKVYLTKKSQNPPDIIIPLKIGKNTFLNYEIHVDEAILPEKIADNQYVNLDFENSYFLRTKNPQDKFQPFGSNQKQKLKSFFINKKIPCELRNKIPLIVLNDEVLCIIGTAISEKLRVKKNEKCYKITVKENQTCN